MVNLFSAIGNVCGDLSSIDWKMLSCEELRWARIEVKEGDLRTILWLVSIVDNGKYLLVVLQSKVIFRWVS